MISGGIAVIDINHCTETRPAHRIPIPRPQETYVDPEHEPPLTMAIQAVGDRWLGWGPYEEVTAR